MRLYRNHGRTSREQLKPSSSLLLSREKARPNPPGLLVCGGCGCVVRRATYKRAATAGTITTSQSTVRFPAALQPSAVRHPKRSPSAAVYRSSSQPSVILTTSTSNGHTADRGGEIGCMSVSAIRKAEHANASSSPFLNSHHLPPTATPSFNGHTAEKDGRIGCMSVAMKRTITNIPRRSISNLTSPRRTYSRFHRAKRLYVRQRSGNYVERNRTSRNAIQQASIARPDRLAP